MYLCIPPYYPYLYALSQSQEGILGVKLDWILLGLVWKGSFANWDGMGKQYIINASQPASDKIFDVSAFEKFLQDRIKVDGLVGNLGDTVQISQVGEGKIEVVAHTEFSGRYLKYL